MSHPELATLDCGPCTLRAWREEDLDSLLRHADNPRVAKWLRDEFPSPYTEQDARDWLMLVSLDRTDLNWAIEVAGEAAGGIGLSPQSDINAGTAEIGYWLAEAYWGQGITTAAVTTLTRHALTELGFRRLYATAFVENTASRRVLEKAGYVLEGILRRSAIKRGEVRDQTLYAFVGDFPAVTS